MLSIMTRQLRWWTLAVFLLLVVVLIVFYLVVGYPTTPMTVPDADRLFGNALPPGTSVENAEAWLVSQGITPSSLRGPFYEKFRRADWERTFPDVVWMDKFGNTPAAVCAGLKMDDVSLYIRITYPDAERMPLARAQIFVYLFFANDRLIKHWVIRFPVGL
jgi:hypothetical protein